MQSRVIWRIEKRLCDGGAEVEGFKPGTSCFLETRDARDSQMFASRPNLDSILVQHVTAKVRVCLFASRPMIIACPRHTQYRKKKTQEHMCLIQEQHPTLPNKKRISKVDDGFQSKWCIG